MKRNIFLRIKIKELAQEARFIRLEETRANAECDYALQNQLTNHRTGRLRTASRETLLAYQYLRGFPYEACERKGSKLLSADSIKAVERMVKTYGHVIFKFEDWTKGQNLIFDVEDKAA